MAIILSDNLKINAPKPVDSRYLNITIPWTGTTQVNAAIPIGERYPGLTVDISGVEYWYQTSGDVTSGNLTIKDSGIASTGITAAINGLTKVGNAVRLGGTLTGSTVITDSRGTPVGIQYGSDYSPNFTLTSLADWQSVATVRPTGQTVGFTLSLPMLGEAVIVNSATPVNVTIPLNSSVAFPIGSIVTIQQGGAGTVTAVGASGVTVNGVVLSTTKQYAFVQYWKTAINTWSVIGGAVEIWTTSGSSLIVPVDSSKRVPVQFISGLTAVLSGYITGATNGIGTTGQKVCLGGALINNTTIGNNTCTLQLKVATLNLTGSTAFNLSTACGLITTSNNKGLEYSTDYSGSFANNSLITKKYVCSQTSGVTANAICLAINGLTKVGNDTVKLGGTLTASTVISDTRVTPLGVEYGGDYRATLNNCSLIPKQYADACDAQWLSSGKTYTDNCDIYYCGCLKCYVTGITTNKADKNIASVGQIIYRDSTQITGCSNMIYCDSIKSLAFGLGNAASGNNSGVFGGESNTASASDSGVFAGETNVANAACSVILGGNDNTIASGNVRSAIVGSQNITLTGSTYIDTVAVDCLAIFNAIGNPNPILCINSATGKVGYMSLGSVAGITGATNGLTETNQCVCLGGALCETTTINGAGENLSLGSTGSRLGEFDVYSSGATQIWGSCMSLSASGATFTDLNTVSFCPKGIQYAGDYSTKFSDNSLVSKKYVDSIATGLNVHAAVLVATTGPITLTGNQTIDGILTTNGDRVLVKNQGTGITGATTNGIYDANSGAWTRSSDYDGTPSGEVSNGDLIPVTSGLTQNNELFAQTALNPITVGITPLIFSLFATVIDVQGGQGVCVTQVGGVHTVCVNATSGCGLAVGVGGLCIDNSIGGNGLTYTGGVLNANACSCGSVPAIPVGYDGSDNLMVAYSDIRTAVNALTGATNGLYCSAHVVKLGCALTEATTICGANTYGLAITGLTTFNLGFGAGDVAGIVKDSNATPHGLQYNGDYSTTFCDNSLVTKKYVVDCTACASAISLKAITGVTNGLTKYACHDACLGGVLATNLAFTNATSGAYGVCFGTGNSCRIDNFLVYSDNIVGLLSQTRLVIGNADSGGTVGVQSLSFCGASGSVVRDDCQSKGLVYAGNYDANFTQYSLVDAQYVTGKTSQAILTACNGLTKSGTAVILGGTITGNTNIYVGTNDCLGIGYNTSAPNAYGGRIQVTTNSTDANTYVDINTKFTTTCSNIHVISTGITLSSNASGFKGAVYSTDYSSNFVPLSLVTKQYVDNQVTGGTAISLANNGLTKTGNTVQLGGCLIHGTIIQQCLNNFQILHTDPYGVCEISFTMDAGVNNIRLGAKDSGAHETAVVLDSSQFEIYSQSASTFQGFTYCNGFNTTVGNKKSCSIPDIGYITGITSCGIITANNGLTKVGQNVALGGSLTGATVICGAQTFSLGCAGNALSAVDVCSSGIITLHGTCTCNCGIVVYDQDYCGSYTPRTLVDKAFVTGCTACANAISLKAITGATNGLSKTDCHNVGLGGTLCCALTTIAAGANNLCISGTYTNMFIDNVTACFCVTTASAGGGKIGIGSSCTFLCTCTGAELGLVSGGLLSIGFAGTGIITDSTLLPLGLQYASDAYRCNFTDCSLVDKGYVLGQITGGTGIHAACNGLTKTVGGVVILGGALTGDTCVSLGAHTMFFTGTSSCGISISTNMVCIGNTINAGSSIGVGGGIDVVVNEGDHNLNICNSSSGVMWGNVNISATRAIKLTASGVTLQTTPPSGVPLVDAVLVWNSTDKQIKTVSGAALGDKNNVYTKTIVSSNTTGTTASTYVILISGASSFTLPSAPIAGQAFKIKDACGNALNAPIIINAGAGKTIDGAGNQCALINTDYGALELVYGITNQWFSLAFVN